MNIITTQSSLDAFCAAVGNDPYITVDTEFLRDKTYYPRLCLLQIAGEQEAAVIDPLAEGIDLAPVFALMQKPSLVKVFHAARQDIEIFHLLSGHIPSPVFDTQIAAAVCGYGESVSYETLVNTIVGEEIDKSSRFTDWSARPLSEKQLVYALADVTHLRPIYEALKQKIEHRRRGHWISEEHARLADPATYRVLPAEAWKRLRVGNMRPRHLAALRELAGWREIEARERDVPRGRILKDEALIELAAALPRKEADLKRLRGIGHLSQPTTKAVLSCIETALALPPSEYPQAKRYQKPPESVTAALPMLQLLLKVTADAEGIAASIIAGKEDLEAIALGQADTPALDGWRYDLFGQKAKALMEGKLKLSLDPKSGKAVIEES